MLFGPGSSLFQILRDRLGLTYKQHCMFLATIVAASQLGMPSTRLYQEDRVSTNGLMDKEELMGILHMIASEKADGGDTIWMQVEEAFNLIAKGKLSERGGANVIVAPDDDKLHYLFSKTSDMYGLKQVCHIQTN